MRIAICIEKNGGVLFNNRRVSQDSAVREKLLSLQNPNNNEFIYMNTYSAKQFENSTQIVVCDDFLQKATNNDICFVETNTIPLEDVQELFIFQWNRVYPADAFFEFDAKQMGFRKIYSENFSGTSHQKITLTVYKKVK